MSRFWTDPLYFIIHKHSVNPVFESINHNSSLNNKVFPHSKEQVHKNDLTLQLYVQGLYAGQTHWITEFPCIYINARHTLIQTLLIYYLV